MKTRYVFLVIAAVSILIYANSLNNAFQYDDQVYLEENTNVKTIGLPDIFLKPSALFAPNTTTGHYRPLVLVSHVVNYRIHGLNPAGYHLVNLAFHVGSAMLLFLIIRAMLSSGEEVRSEKLEVRSKTKSNILPLTSNFSPSSSSAVPLTSNFYIALTAALIFAVHPFNSEVVNYITARSSVMSGFFYLLAFYCWVRYRGEKIEDRSKTKSYLYLGSLFAFLLGMLCKEVVITLPVVLWLYDIYFVHSRRTPPHSTLRRLFNWHTYLPYLPFVVAVVVPALIIRIIFWGDVMPSFKRSPLVQIYTSLPVLVKHIRLFVFPVGLNIDHYSEIYNAFFTWPVAGSALILILYAVLAVFAYRSKSIEWRVVSFFMIWFFIVLIPTTAVTLNAIFQENRGYLAIIVFTVFAGVMLGKLSSSLSEPHTSRGFTKNAEDALPLKGRDRAGMGVLIILVFLYGAGTVYRNSIWSDGVSLWSDAVAKSPESSLAHTNLGTEYANLGKSEMATRHLLKALRFSDPDSRAHLANIHYNLGAVYQQMGRDDMALGEYRHVTELRPSDFRPHYNLGVLYQQRGEDEAALEAYRDALKRNPADFRSYHNMGLLYQNRREMSLAAEYYRKALSINPDYAKSRVNLEAIYGQNG